MTQGRPVVRTLLLCLALLSTTGLVVAVPGTPREAVLSWPVLVALFLGGALLLVHLSSGEESHTFTFTEVPLVVGLLLADAWPLVLARVAGELLALVLLPRQPWLKLCLNLSVFLAETCVALAVLHALQARTGWTAPEDPRTWAVVALAVGAALVVSNGAVHAVIRWHGARPALGPVLASAAGTAAVNTTLGLVAVLLLQVHRASVLLLAVVAVTLAAGYRGYSSLFRRYASLRLLHGFSEAIGAATSPEQVVAAMLEHARTLLRAEVADLAVLPLPGSDRAVLRAVDRGGEVIRHRPDGPALMELRALADAGASRLVPRGTVTGPAVTWARGHGCLDGALVPLVLGDGDALVLGVAGRLDEVSTFDEEDLRLLETLAVHAAMALEKGRLIDALRSEVLRREHQALHDALTGLPNRLQFTEQADARLAAARGRGGAVLLLDLDGFKEVNDTLGHHTGDDLLQEVGRRLQACLGPGDLAARLGGDEFALLLDLGPEPSPADLEAAVGRVRRAVETSVQLAGIDLDVRASTGAAVWPEHGEDASTLLQRADVAMYQAKGSAARFARYDPELDTHTPRRLQLASDLRRGIDEGQLLVHYQPKADLRTGAIVGAEALVRWDHPAHGRVRPDEFIPVAEQTGLVTGLTWVVLETALADVAGWQDGGAGLSVAVNVSVRSLLEPGFVERVLATVAGAGVPPSRLVLELTESSIMGDTGRTLEVLERLRRAGVRLSVDDFGTGYSSLAYLQRLPVSELKVDRSFVRDLAVNPSDRAIVQSVVDLGHSLGLSVVAEGMENQLTWDSLRSMGCDLGQGYLLSPPLPAGELSGWLRTRAATTVPAPRGGVPAHR